MQMAFGFVPDYTAAFLNITRLFIGEWDPTGTAVNQVRFSVKIRAGTGGLDMFGEAITNAASVSAGTFTGSASGLTNLAPSSIVGGWTGIITNWGTGMGVNSNRQYISFGIVTNVTRP